MGGTFTRVSEDAFEALQLNAGVLLSTFDLSDPYTVPDSDDIIATTTGGINPTCTPTYSDFGEDVDNVPNNMMEFKHLDGWECAMAFSSIKFNAENTKWALGAADISNVTGGLGIKKIVPRGEVKLTDFSDLWWVGDKADGGAFAIKLINGLSTGGLNIQSTKNGKGTNQMTITGHVSLANQDVMPMEFYDIPAPEGSVTEYSYTAVTPVGTENPAEEGWYVLVGDSYRLTNDTEVDSNVTYYEKESV